MRISKQKIEVLMVKQGLTLTELAKRSGVSRQNLATIRTRETCQTGTAARLCVGLGCSIDDIIPSESEGRA